jgi:hypothetical protein
VVSALLVVGFAALLFRLIPLDGVRAPTEDNGCHDLFADGATRVSPRFQINLKVSNDDWPELTDLLEEFAESHNWSLRNTSRPDNGVVKTLEISACAPNQPLIGINELRWASNDYAPLLGRGVEIALYGNVPEPVWQPVAREIVTMLESRWPNNVKFLSGSGHEIERPEFLVRREEPAQQ